MSHLPLPPGYRFNPRDEELINHYLWRRLLYGESPRCPRMPLVNNIFGEEADHPSTVFNSFGISDRQEEDTVRYFFTIPKTVANDKGCAKNRIRAAGKYGTWKLQRSDPVMVKNSNGEDEVVGFRKLLKFMESKSSVGGVNNGVEWSMHEFSSSKVEDNNFKEEYVLCRITKKVSNKLVGKKRAQESGSCDNVVDDDKDLDGVVDVIQENKRRRHVDVDVDVDIDVFVPVIEGVQQQFQVVSDLEGNSQGQEGFDNNNKELEVDDDIEAELAKLWGEGDDEEVGFSNANNTTHGEVDSVNSTTLLVHQSESDEGCDTTDSQQLNSPSESDFEFDFYFEDDDVEPSQTAILDHGLVWPRQLDL